MWKGGIEVSSPRAQGHHKAYGVTEPGPPTREHQDVDLDPYTFVASVQIGLHVGLLTSVCVGPVSVPVPCHWVTFPLPPLPSWDSVGEDMPRTRYPRMGWYPMGTPLL